MLEALPDPERPESAAEGRADRISGIAPRPTPLPPARELVKAGLRASELLVMHVVWAPADPSPPPAALASRVLAPEELARAATDPALDLDLMFVQHALRKGDRCVGLFEGGELVSYGFYATTPTEVAYGLAVRWNEPSLVYMYKGFTRADRRGGGYYRRCLADARHLLAAPERTFFAFISRTNTPSLRAAERAGYAARGSTVLSGHFGGRSFVSRAPSDLGVRIARVPRSGGGPRY